MDKVDVLCVYIYTKTVKYVYIMSKVSKSRKQVTIEAVLQEANRIIHIGRSYSISECTRASYAMVVQSQGCEAFVSVAVLIHTYDEVRW